MRLMISLLVASMTIGVAQAEQTAVKKGKTAKPVTEAVEIIEATTIAIRGKPAYESGFTKFKYVNAEAPKSGLLKNWTRGTFDNFNRYAQRGDPAIGTGTPRASIGIYETLMRSSDDDLLSVYYPFIAEKISYKSDFSEITFYIDKRARFEDGEPIKPSDIKFSFEKFVAEGIPGLKEYFSFVEKVEVLDDVRVRFSLKTKNKSNMIALCSTTIVPEHFWKDHRLDEPLKVPPIGSGAYRVADYKFGKFVKYERIKNYWADDLPVMRGLFNDAEVQYDYYLDETVAFEAFKAGHIEILVATTVIEVGVDVSNATVILIEHPERFGLAQLHQLRGRVGRGADQSYCLLLRSAENLMTQKTMNPELPLTLAPLSPENSEGASLQRNAQQESHRLKVFTRCADGFSLAEEDLKMRGPGNVLGVQQWGTVEFLVANLLRDRQLLLDARRVARDLLSKDPQLHSFENQGLKAAMLRKWGKTFELGGIG